MVGNGVGDAVGVSISQGIGEPVGEGVGLGVIVQSNVGVGDGVRYAGREGWRLSLGISRKAPEQECNEKSRNPRAVAEQEVH